MKIAIEECIFTDCYCEENVWKLIENISEKLFSNNSEWDGFAVIISNENKRVPFWHQNRLNSICLWDYHVIFILQHKQHLQQVLVYDLSSQLSKKIFPIPFNEYIQQSLLTNFYVSNPQARQEVLELLYKTKFRIIPAKEYFIHFSSDRSHMKQIDPKTNSEKWLAPPPKYPCIIQPNNCTGHLMNLPKLWDMSYNEYPQLLGTILSFEEFCERFGMELLEKKET